MNTLAATSARFPARLLRALRLLALPALAGLGAGAASAQSISELGNISCQTAAISADGSVVAGTMSTGTGYHAFRWTAADGMQDLGDYGYNSDAFAVSADGTCVVGWAPLLINRPDGSTGIYARMVRWTAADGMQNLGGSTVADPTSGIANGGIARAVNINGSIIAGDGGGLCGLTESFRWTAATGTQSLGTSLGSDMCHSNVTVMGLSLDGSVAVGQNNLRAYRWVLGAGMIDLGNLTNHPARTAFAKSISHDGTTIVGTWGVNAAGYIMQAFRWRESVGMENLGSLEGAGVDPSDGGHICVSADGSVVVGSSYTADGPRPFLWTQELGMVNLQAYLPAIGVDLTGWTLCYASGISADGRTIIGNACGSPGGTAGFIIKLPAILPSCFTLSSVANAAICPDGSVGFSVSATGAGSFSYQWQIQDEDNPGAFRNLADGLLLSDSVQVAELSGTRTAHLALRDVGYATDPLWLSTPHTFRCLAFNTCGTKPSNAATMSLSTNCCKPNFLTASGCLGPVDLLQYLSLYFTNFDGQGSAVPGDNQTFPDLNPTGIIYAVPCTPSAPGELPVITASGLKADFDHDCQIGPTDLLSFLNAYFNPTGDCFSGCGLLKEAAPSQGVKPLKQEEATPQGAKQQGMKKVTAR